MQIEMRSLSSIRPYEGNPRDNDAAVDGVVKSIQTFGFRQPIVVDAAGVIVIGHTRYKAALKMGLAEVPVHVAADLSPEKARAYRIADNKTAEAADWNNDLLSIELSALQEAGVDLGDLGFDQTDLQELLYPEGQQGLVDPDRVPAPPAAATTQPGDIWILGEHRLMCGDSSDPAALDRLLAGQPIHLVNTDPPYNVKVEPRSNNAIAAGLSSATPTHHQGLDLARDHGKANRTSEQLRPKDRPLLNDFISDEDFARLLGSWFGNIARVLLPGHAFYIWGGYGNFANYPKALVDAGLYHSQAIVWFKDHAVLTRKDFMGNHEWCFYGWREGAGHRFFGPPNIQDVWLLRRASAGTVQLGSGVRIEVPDGSRIDILPPDGDRRIRNVTCAGEVSVFSTSAATDVWSVKKVSPQSMVHLTEKPVELAERALRYSTLAGENVLDLFGGSGSTLIAAERMGRRAYLMEMDPLYCDVIVNRWCDFTGRKAEHVPVAAPVSG